MMMPRLRVLVALLAVLALAGCASIPSSGAVNAGIELGDSNTIELDILARGPQDGDSQEQILQGFLAAAASPQLDYRIAREFLTADFSKDWKPDSASTVDQPADRSVSVTSETSMSLRIKPVATVADDGVFSAAVSGAAETRNYSFEQVGGQWRISAAPQGIVIDQPTFGIVFGKYALEFFSPDGQFLVPDVRWFARRETTQTAIVRALVAGPVDWLEAAVTSAVPIAARLDADSVPVSASTATVNLAVDTVPSAETLSRIQTQMQASLAGVSGISSVSLAINGTTENITALVPAPIQTPRVDTRPVVLTADGFGYVSSVSGQIEPMSALATGLAELSPTAIALGVNAGYAAVLTASGVFRVTPAGNQSVWSGVDWLAPAADPYGGIWSARGAAKLSWSGPDGGNAEFTTGWGSDELTAISVSRDGSRVAATLRSGNLSRLVVSAISRGGDGSPTGLGAPLLVSEFEGDVRGLAWADPTAVSVLRESDVISNVTIGGQASVLSAPAGATALATGNSVRELRVLTSSGELAQPSGASWQVRASGVRVLAQQTGLR